MSANDPKIDKKEGKMKTVKMSLKKVKQNKRRISKKKNEEKHHKTLNKLMKSEELQTNMLKKNYRHQEILGWSG
jgi:hypothetical protein